jgi:hypothetical protein
MSYIRGRDPNDKSKFAIECYDYDGNLIKAHGGFATAQEADQAAQIVERSLAFPKIDDCDMSDDELLAELMR